MKSSEKYLRFQKIAHYITIDFVRKLKDKYDVKIELIKDDKPNALLYKDRDMVPLSSITKEWYEYLMKLNELKCEIEEEDDEGEKHDDSEKILKK